MTLYDSYGLWKEWEAGGFGQLSWADEAYFTAELTAAGIRDVHGLDVLEIGFGGGAFAAWANTRGAQWHGTDLLPERVTAARGWGLDARLAPERLSDEFTAGSADLIVAWDVLEHMDQSTILSTLRDARVCLRPVGLFIARVPSGDSPFGRAVQHGDLTHRTTLGSSAVHQLAKHLEFDVVAVRSPRLPLRGAGFRSFFRRAGVRLARSATEPLVRRLFMGGEPTVLSPSMVFVLRKPS